MNSVIETSSQNQHRVKKFYSNFTPARNESNTSNSVNISVEILVLNSQAGNASSQSLDDLFLVNQDITQFALLAHPYGPLGGSSHDPLIRRLASYLVNLNWMVVLFDARGVGRSTGRTSWTTLPEVNDFQSILDQLLKPIMLRFIERNNETHSDDKNKIWTLLRGGYSHGALVASASTPIILPAGAPSLESRLLLISYPVSYLWALTSFHVGHFRKALEGQLLRSDQKVLITYGDSDQFTSQKAYRKWVGDLKSGISSDLNLRNKLSTIESSETDHFWNGKHSRFCQIFGEWLTS